MPDSFAIPTALIFLRPTRSCDITFATLSKLTRQLDELRRYDEQLRHYADQRIALDLDDGVKVNYAKFGDLLAEVKAVCGKDSE